jgi:tetratricopeptide (TPR) repeat protein
MKNLRWNSVSVFALLLLFALSSLPAFGQGNTLEVKCLDQGGNPVSGVKVVIDPMEGHKLKDKKSDGKGVAEFTKLDDGVYRIFGRKEGLAPVSFEFANIRGGARQSVTLSFQPGEMAKKLHFEDQESIKQSFAAMDQADNLLRDGKLADAEKLYLSAIEMNPANPQAHLNLALTYLQLGMWDMAGKSMKRAQELSDALRMVPGPGQNIYGTINERAKDLTAKLPMIRLRSEADKALSDRRFDDAAAKYREALKLEANDSDLYYNLGLALANGKKFEDANQAIDKAIQLAQAAAQKLDAEVKAMPDGPQKTEQTARLGEMNKSLVTFGDLKKRAAEFRENEILRQAQGILGEGDKLFNSGDYPNALKKYEEARPMVPQAKQSIVYAQMAKTYAQMKQPDQAIASFRKAMEISPENDEFRKGLAQFYMNEKRYEEALNLYAEGGGSGQADQALLALGQKLNGQGNAEVAALAFEKAIKANAQNAEAYYELGMLLFYEKKNDAKARETLDKYLQLGKNADHINNTKNVLVVVKRRMSK